MEATAFLLLFDYVLPKRIWAEKNMRNFWVISFSISIFSFLWVNENGDRIWGQCLFKSSLLTSSISITWELFRNSGSLSSPQTHWIRNPGVRVQHSLLEKKKNQVGLMQGNICQLLPTGNAKHQVGPDWLISSLSELPTLPGPPAYLHPLMWRRNKLLLLETSVIFCLLFVFLKYLFIGVSLM